MTKTTGRQHEPGKDAPRVVGLSRAEAAKMLSTSVASIIRLERAGRLHPRQTERGTWLHDLGEVERVRDQRSRAGLTPTTRAQVEAAAWARFDQGATAREVVRELGADPRAIVRAYAAWAGAGALVLPAPEVARLRAAGLLLDEPAKVVETILAWRAAALTAATKGGR